MQFQRTIGIDYSGAETADSSLKGLRVYITERGGAAIEVPPPVGPKRYWTRRGLAEWLTARLVEDVPTIAGIDHSFSFPDAYFARHNLPRDWDAFLEDFHGHWPTDQKNLYVDFVRDGIAGLAYRRGGDTRWRRKTEEITRAKSVFHFDVTGQVAKSTHAGLPFLRAIRLAMPKLHIWPFDAWIVPHGASALVEIYPRLYGAGYSNHDRTQDQQDAFVAASWLRDADQDGRLAAALQPRLSDATRQLARHEGWILGVETEVPVLKGRSTKTLSQRSTDMGTTAPGYRNRNGQTVIAATGRPGTDHNQRVYHLQCSVCGLNYGANGSDIHSRKCPRCGGGAPGLVI